MKNTTNKPRVVRAKRSEIKINSKSAIKPELLEWFNDQKKSFNPVSEVQSKVIQNSTVYMDELAMRINEVNNNVSEKDTPEDIERKQNMTVSDIMRKILFTANYMLTQTPVQVCILFMEKYQYVPRVKSIEQAKRAKKYEKTVPYEWDFKSPILRSFMDPKDLKQEEEEEEENEEYDIYGNKKDEEVERDSKLYSLSIDQEFESDFSDLKIKFKGEERVPPWNSIMANKHAKYKVIEEIMELVPDYLELKPGKRVILCGPKDDVPCMIYMDERHRIEKRRLNTFENEIGESEIRAFWYAQTFTNREKLSSHFDLIVNPSSNDDGSENNTMDADFYDREMEKMTGNVLFYSTDTDVQLIALVYAHERISSPDYLDTSRSAVHYPPLSEFVLDLENKDSSSSSSKPLEKEKQFALEKLEKIVRFDHNIYVLDGPLDFNALFLERNNKAYEENSKNISSSLNSNSNGNTTTTTNGTRSKDESESPTNKKRVYTKNGKIVNVNNYVLEVLATLLPRYVSRREVNSDFEDDNSCEKTPCDRCRVDPQNGVYSKRRKEEKDNRKRKQRGGEEEEENKSGCAHCSYFILLRENSALLHNTNDAVHSLKNSDYKQTHLDLKLIQYLLVNFASVCFLLGGDYLDGFFHVVPETMLNAYLNHARDIGFLLDIDLNPKKQYDGENGYDEIRKKATWVINARGVNTLLKHAISLAYLKKHRIPLDLTFEKGETTKKIKDRAFKKIKISLQGANNLLMEVSEATKKRRMIALSKSAKVGGGDTGPSGIMDKNGFPNDDEIDEKKEAREINKGKESEVDQSVVAEQGGNYMKPENHLNRILRLMWYTNYIYHQKEVLDPAQFGYEEVSPNEDTFCGEKCCNLCQPPLFNMSLFEDEEEDEDDEFYLGLDLEPREKIETKRETQTKLISDSLVEIKDEPCLRESFSRRKETHARCEKQKSKTWKFK